MKLFVRGFTWKARMSNDAVFEFWTPSEITRKEAQIKLLDMANGDYLNVYDKTDIIHMWGII